MEGTYIYIKEEQPWEETYAEEDGLNSHEIESKTIVSSPLEGPSVKKAPVLPSQTRDSKGSNFNIKKEDIEDFIKEEVDIPQFSFDATVSSSGSVNPAHFKKTRMDKWRRSDICQLIDLFQDKPCLWQVTNKEYKDRNKRCLALTKISEELKDVDVTAEDVKKKLHTLRGQYNRESQIKQKSMKSSAAGATDVYEPRLWCFDLLHFLGDTANRRHSSSSLDKDLPRPMSPLEESQLTIDDREEDVIDKDISHAMPPTSSSNVGKKKKILPEKYAQKELYQAGIKRLSQPKEPMNDRFSEYGNRIGFDLRKIDSENPRQAQIAKKLINDVIFMGYTNTLTMETSIVNVSK